MLKKIILWPIYEKLVVMFSLVIHMSALLWGLTALKFSFDIRAPRTPKYEQKYNFSYFGFKLKNCQIVSLFDMYIELDMGERIAGRQDRPSPIIEDSPQGPLNSPKYTFYLHIWKKNGFQNVVHVSPLWWGLHLLTFRCPWILCKI